MEEDLLPITCPLCGRSSDHPVENLTEGAPLVCPLCNVKLVLHGHMLEDIQKQLAERKQHKTEQ